MRRPTRLELKSVTCAGSRFTGSATGPLGAYLVRHRLVTASGRVAIVSDQGVKMGRHSRLHIRGVARDGHLDEIEVGGSVVPVIDGTLRVPAA